MLEKIGLPSKPSMKGGNWVIDASHCQGCASQFTFINRKHHCRRCGGLFCGTCTSQRMYLRGQGDSAVRICDSCKKLEEAARFEMRHGSKTKPLRGSTNSDAKIEDSLMSKVLGTHSKEISSTSSISSSSALHLEEKSVTVDILRQQAIEEKQKHKILKKEGKNKEALEAFKRGKELERQANALELAERKNRRKPPPSNSPPIDDLKRGKRVSQNADDDIFTELNKLGWSESETINPKACSAEDEFSLLLKETSQPASIPSNRSEVIALKKAAVALKKQGKLAEAKEELKKAKALERKIEEEELLNAEEHSEDEISAMIREMGDVKDDDVTFDESLIDENVEVSDADLIDPEMESALASFGWIDEPSEDQRTSITLPKTHVTIQNEEQKSSITPPKSRIDIQRELIAVKKKALALRREGRVEEAEEELKKCGALENHLASVSDAPRIEDDSLSDEVTDEDLTNPAYLSTLKSIGWEEKDEEETKPNGKTKIEEQRELLAMKRKSLALRREGKIDEAEILEAEFDKQRVPTENEAVKEHAGDDLRRAKGKESPGNGEKSGERKVLSGRERFKMQQQVLGHKREAMKLRREGRVEEAESEFKLAKEMEAKMDGGREEEGGNDDVAVGLLDGELLSALKAIGIEGISPNKKMKMKEGSGSEDRMVKASSGDVKEMKVSDDEINGLKEEIKEEKKKAVALKRQGNVTEALKVLRNAKLLEAKLNHFITS